MKYIALLALLLFAHTGSSAKAGNFSLSATTDFTTGNYGGATATDIWYIPFTARYDKGRASFRVIVPYLNKTGPSNVLGPGIGGIIATGGSGLTTTVVCDEAAEGCLNSTLNLDDKQSTSSMDAASASNTTELSNGLNLGGTPIGGLSPITSTKSGLGDIVTAFSYNLIDHASTGIAFDITTRLKIPTADASQHLGSGRVDYAIQGDLYKAFSKVAIIATFGYRILGNPTGYTFHNVLFGAASLGYRLSPNVALGASYTMGQSPVRLQDSRDLTLYLTQRLTDQIRLNVYGLHGFSERSPDWGGGINLRYVF